MYLNVSEVIGYKQHGNGHVFLRISQFTIAPCSVLHGDPYKEGNDTTKVLATWIMLRTIVHMSAFRSA